MGRGLFYPHLPQKSQDALDVSPLHWNKVLVKRDVSNLTVSLVVFSTSCIISRNAYKLSRGYIWNKIISAFVDVCLK